MVLLGDQHQLPPVVKHLTFKKYSQFDQSLFARFIRLGVPTVQLDQQGRSRAEICALYSWRYSTAGGSLTNLPVIEQDSRFRLSNVGFRRTFQFINVENFDGRGESCSSPFMYQNIGEAEYIVAVYMYMRLVGYPAQKISILTTYNGQKYLIRDIIEQRCQNPIFGKPAKITTVDKFQGQQNDYVLLSLVRTESVGHLRDIRRLVVAMSRAKLGLYVFGRQKLFENCFELAPIFSMLTASGSKLELVISESCSSKTERNSCDDVLASDVNVIENVSAMAALVDELARSTKFV
jgi:intron-binding protein aquarius